MICTLGRNTEGDDTDIGPKYVNQIIAKEENEQVARLVKKMLTSFKYGNFKPKYVYKKLPADSKKEAADATFVVHEFLTSDPDFVLTLDDMARASFHYTPTVVKCSFLKEIEVITQEMQEVPLGHLQELQEDPDINIIEIEEVPQSENVIDGTHPEVPDPLAADGSYVGPLPNKVPPTPGLPPPNTLYNVKVEVLEDISRVEIDLVKPCNFIMSEGSTKMRNIALIGEDVMITKQDLVSKFMKYYDADERMRILEEIEEVFGEGLEGSQEEVAMQDVYVRVQEQDQVYTIRAVRLNGDHYLLIEDVGVIPYVVFMYDRLPASFCGVSISERLAQHQRILTRFDRKLMVAADNSATTRMRANRKNLKTILASRQAGQLYDQVEDPKDVLFHQSSFPADVPAYKNTIEVNADSISGKTGEFNPPVSANITSYEAIARDEAANSLADYRLTIFSYAISRLFEITYQQMVQYLPSKRVYSKDADEWKNYDFSTWPLKLQFVPSIGFGRGTRTYNLVSYERLIQIAMQLKQAGAPMVSDEGLLMLLNNYVDELNLPEDKYFEIKETSDEEQQPNVGMELLKLENEKLQIQVQRLQLESAKLEMSAAEKSKELELKEIDQKHDHAVEEAKLDIAQQRADQQEDRLILEARKIS